MKELWLEADVVYIRSQAYYTLAVIAFNESRRCSLGQGSDVEQPGFRTAVLHDGKVSQFIDALHPILRKLHLNLEGVARVWITPVISAFADMDASPTKAWLVLHRHEAQWKRFYDIAFARRPGEELYDLGKDPYQMNNVATDSRYAREKEKMATGLMKILSEAGDPRVTGDGRKFEQPPFTNPSPQERQRKKR